MSPEEIQAALTRGKDDPTLAAVVTFVEAMCAATVGEATGFWTASTVNGLKDLAKAEFVVAMEKAGTPSEG